MRYDWVYVPHYYEGAVTTNQEPRGLTVLAVQRFVWGGFRQSHFKDVNEHYFKCCHVLPHQ